MQRAARNYRKQKLSATAVFAVIIAMAVLLVTPFGTSFASAQGLGTTTLLVQFQPGVDAAARAASVAAFGGKIVGWMPQIGVAEVHMPVDTAGVAPAAAFDTAVIRFVERDVVVTGDLIVEDPAVLDPDQGYGLQKLNVQAAWNVTTGYSGTIVAIVDSGLTISHTEFAGRIVAGYDFVNGDADPTDDHGHGTHVAGIIGAALDGQGTAGVCPGCSIMPIKVLNANNAGTWGGVAKGVLYAVDNGARVINLSLGATVSSLTLENAITYAHEHGVIVVAAAGNAASSAPFYPAALEHVVAVSATNKQDALWVLSNTGDHIDLAAPGYRIYSTYKDFGCGTGYTYMSGTSMAAPYVAGLAGLVISQDETLTGEAVIALMQDNADDLGDPGSDANFGAGRINAYWTLVAANGGIEPEPENPDGRDNVVATGIYLPLVATIP
jgi:thermitase